MKYLGNKFIKVLGQKYWLIILIIIFLFSFLLDIYLLTRYSLSYGTDGAFYDIQIRSILNTGFPYSNDPPMIYYLLTPFVILTGNSFLGIKIGMVFLGSLMAFPAFLLTQCYTWKNKLDPKVPALLSAFLITININYFTMIGDFMQNLVGVVFLIFLMYFTIKWLENINNWRKYGVLTVIFLGSSFLTHIYTGALAIILFSSLLLFNIIFKSYKSRKLPRFDLKILELMILLSAGCFALIFIIYPQMFSKFMTFLISSSNFSSSASNNMGVQMVGSPISGTIFFSFPYLLGIAASLIILYNGLKEKIQDKKMNINTLLAWLYLTLGITIGILSFLNTEFQTRFVFLAFLPIALIIPLGLKYFESLALVRYPAKKTTTTVLATLIAVAFAFSSLYVASGTFMNLKPTITDEEYQELLNIKESHFNNSNAVVIIDFQSIYWAKYTLGVEVHGADNLSEVEKEVGNRSLYILSKNQKENNSGGPPQGQSNSGGPPGSNIQQKSGYSGGFLLPYGPPLIPGSIDKIPSLNSQHPPVNMTEPVKLNISGATIYRGKYFSLIKIR